MSRRRVYRVDPDKRDLAFWRQDEPHKSVFALCERLRRSLSGRLRDMFHYECLYDDDETASLVQRNGAIGEYTPQTLTSNIVRRHVDTYVAYRAKSRTLPMALTEGADASARRRARMLNKYFAALLDQVNFWETRELTIRDSCIYGSGLAFNWRDGTELKHDRVKPYEVLYDPVEAEQGIPRTVHLVRTMDRNVAMSLWPKHAAAIRNSADHFPSDPVGAGFDDVNDLVLVVESWHLPSRKGAGDGRHTICVEQATLSNGDFVWANFPLSKRDFSPPVRGWLGSGMCAQLAGLQYEVNAVGLKLQERHYMTGTFVLIDDASGAEIDLMDNGTLTEVRYRGAQPTFVQPPAAHPDLLQYYMQLRGDFPAQETRLSEMTTRGEVPANFRSGRAQRVFKDIEAAGFTPDDRRDERYVIHTAWQLFDLSAEADEELRGQGEAFKVAAEVSEHGRRRLEPLEFRKLEFDRETLKLRTFPVNYLSSIPADKYEQVADMMGQGLVTHDEAMELLDFPDLERVQNLKTATRRFCETVMTRILEADDPYAPTVFIRPEPPMDLQLCIALGTMLYVDALTAGGVGTENLRAASDWIESTRQAASPPQPDPGAQPPAEGGFPPDPTMDPAAGGPQVADPTMDPALQGPPVPPPTP